MVRCSRCGHENKTTSSCALCGAPLHGANAAVSPSRSPVPAAGPGAPVRCPACGGTVPSGFKFCGVCGTPMSSSRPLAPTRPSAVSESRHGAPRARLAVLGADGAVVSTLSLVQDETTIGSAGDLRLNDPYVAPVQGRLVFRGPQLLFHPESTLNGIFLLLKAETALQLGSEFRVGRQLLRLDAFPAAPPPDEPVWGSPNPGYRHQAVQMLQGGVEGDVFPLRQGENLVGRTGGDLSFPGDGYVSSRHAMLSVRGERVTLTDLGSSNGTFLRIQQPCPLSPGDLLLVGEQILRLDPA